MSLRNEIIRWLNAQPADRIFSSRDIADALHAPLAQVQVVGASLKGTQYRSGGGMGRPVRWHGQGGKHADILPTDIATAKAHLTRLSNENKRLRQILADRELFAALVREYIQPYPPVVVRAKPTACDNIVAILALADWHIGEVVDAAQNYGVSYNMQLAQAGITSITERFLKWIELNRRGYNIQRLVIFVLGDMVSGNIHPELEITNEATLPECAAKAGMMLGGAVQGLGAHFAHVDVVCVAGNHGRLSQEVRYKNSFRQSIEWITYILARELTSQSRHVIWHLSDDPMPRLTIEQQDWPRAYTIAGLHGHQIRAAGITPYYGLGRRANMILKEACRSSITVPDMILVGHFHQFAILEDGLVVLVPSLMGGNEWSRSMGYVSRAGQAACLLGARGPFDFISFGR